MTTRTTTIPRRTTSPRTTTSKGGGEVSLPAIDDATLSGLVAGLDAYASVLADMHSDAEEQAKAAHELASEAETLRRTLSGLTEVDPQLIDADTAGALDDLAEAAAVSGGSPIDEAAEALAAWASQVAAMAEAAIAAHTAAQELLASYEGATPTESTAYQTTE